MQSQRDPRKTCTSSTSHSKGASSRLSTSTAASRRNTLQEYPHDTRFLVALRESKDHEIGIAAMDMHSPQELLLSHILDSRNYVDTLTWLEILQPKEILVTPTIQVNSLYQSILHRYERSDVKIVQVRKFYSECVIAKLKEGGNEGRKRKSIYESLLFDILYYFYSPVKGATEMKRIAFNCLEVPIVKNRFIAASVNSLIRYMEYNHNVHIAEKTVKVDLRSPNAKLQMNYSTIQSLELVSNNRSYSVKQSLIGDLDQTETAAGSQLLRTNLMAPCCHLPTINERLDLVDILVDNTMLFFELVEILPSFNHADKLLVQMVLIPKNVTTNVCRRFVTSILDLKATLEGLPRAINVLRRLKSSATKPSVLLDTILQALDQECLSDAIKTVDAKVNPLGACPMNNEPNITRMAVKRVKECFAVKKSISALLDTARSSYVNIVGDIYNLGDKLRSTYGIPGLKVKHAVVKGYHLTIPAGYCASSVALPNVFICQQKQRKVICCTTKELEILNTRFDEVSAEVYRQSYVAVQGLLEEMRPFCAYFQMMVECIGLLDMLMSFAHRAARSPIHTPYVRPIVQDNWNLVIKEGRHSIVETFQDEITFTPVNVLMDALSNFQIITGRNCSGKSTYLRTIAIIVILAHIGCYVPASSAYIRLTDRIFTRVTTEDNMEENLSTFAMEMIESCYILENATDRSLVIIDELGRGTSNQEGFSIVWSIAEELILRQTFVFFVTHYLELMTLAQCYSNAKNYHFNPDKLTGRFLEQGPMPIDKVYGIEIAIKSGFPLSIIENANSVNSYLREEENKGQMIGSNDRQKHLGTTEERLLRRLLFLKDANFNVSALRRQLQLLRNRFVKEME